MYYELKIVGKKIRIELFFLNLWWVVGCPQKMRKKQNFPKYMGLYWLLVSKMSTGAEFLEILQNS